MNRRIRETIVLVKSDPRRATILAVLLVVLGAMSIRAFWTIGPARSQARTPAPGASAGARNAASAGGESARAIRELARTAGVVVPEVAQVGLAPIVALTAPPPLARDVFRLNADAFPPPLMNTDSHVAPKSAPPKADDSSGTVPAPPVVTVEQRIGQESQKLKVRSTLVGNQPLAVFELAGDRRTHLVVPGQSIAGFKLVSVTPSGVVLEKEGVKVEIARSQ